MRFTFSRTFYLLLAAGFIPLSVAWTLPWLTYVVFAFDVLLIAIAIGDYFGSRSLMSNVVLRREFDRRFAIGDAVRVSLHIDNPTANDITLHIKDEYPPEMRLDEGRESEFAIPPHGTAEFYYHLTPPKRGKYQFGATAVRYRFAPRSRLVSGGGRQGGAGQGLSEYAAGTRD